MNIVNKEFKHELLILRNDTVLFKIDRLTQGNIDSINNSDVPVVFDVSFANNETSVNERLQGSELIKILNSLKQITCNYWDACSHGPILFNDFLSKAIICEKLDLPLFNLDDYFQIMVEVKSLLAEGKNINAC